MLPMIVNSPAAPLLLMFLFLLLLVFLLWQAYWRRYVRLVLYPLQAVRALLQQNLTDASSETLLEPLAAKCATHPALAQAWQAYRHQLLPDQQAHLRSQYPAAHWFSADNFSADLPPLGLAVTLLLSLAIVCGLGWWLVSAGALQGDWAHLLSALQAPNAGAMGLLVAGLLATGWLTQKRAQAVQRIEGLTRALVQALDARFPLADACAWLEQLLSEQAEQNLLNVTLLANALRENQPAVQVPQAMFQVQQTIALLPDILTQQQQSMQIFFSTLQQQSEQTHAQQAAFMQQLQVPHAALDTAIAQSASALHDFVKMLGYLNRVIPESLEKSGDKLLQQVSQAGALWQSELAEPLQALNLSSTRFAQHLQAAGKSLEQAQQALTQTATQLAQSHQPLMQATHQFSNLLPDIQQQTLAAQQNIHQIAAMSSNLQHAINAQTQGLDNFLAQQGLFMQQFEKHQKSADSFHERLLEISKTLNYVTIELQERTNLVQTAVIETAETVTRLESLMQRLPSSTSEPLN